MASQQEHQLTLKLLIDNKSDKVLFAEAGKSVVDFLFNLLSMPISSVIKLLTKDQMVGCIANLYRSVETLDTAYMLSNQNKTILLNPTTISLTSNALFLTGPSSSSPSQKKYYKCSNKSCINCPSLSSFGTGSSTLFGTVAAHSSSPSFLTYSPSPAPTPTPTPTPRKVCGSNYYTEAKNVACPTCACQMSTEMQLLVLNPQPVTKAEAGVGFVKGVVTYTVMDDLSVMPMSSISSIALLNKLNVKDVGSLEERTVTLGMEEGLELLKASLQSKTVLTDVFMRKKTGNCSGCGVKSY